MEHGLAEEHPSCDRNQALILILFFAVWIVDSVGFFILGYSTVIFEALTFPLLLTGTAVLLCLGLYLISKSHKAVLEQVTDPPYFVDSGVYSWIGHPMYLGSLLFCFAFLFVSFSLAALGIWIAFFIAYDRMTIYEENSLIKMLGEQYLNYKKRVGKWVPRLY
jgi:protein-S-isoprenylcysteine O-methyltransferase Ste14